MERVQLCDYHRYKGQGVRIALVEPASMPDIVRRGLRIGYGEITEPLGILYIASSLLLEGFDVKVVSQKQRDVDDILREIKKISPDVVGFTCVTTNYQEARKIAEGIKALCNSWIIFGGIHASTSPEIATEKFIDFVTIGESEATIVELVKNLENKKAWKKIKGIAYAQDGKLIITEPRERIQNLDEVPFPYRNKELLSGLRGNVLSYPPIPQQRLASMMLCRGCRFNCVFCTNKAMWQQKQFYRSPKNIIHEMRLLIEKFGVNYIYFHDENIASDKKLLVDICNTMIKEGLYKQLHWYCMANVRDLRGEEELLRLMNKAGCTQIAYGIETGDNKVLKYYHKPQTLSTAREVVEMTFHAGIIPAALFVIGAPSETHQTLEHAKKFAHSIWALRYRFAILYPYKGTLLREEVDSKNLWLSEEHKKEEKATTEEAVIKCIVEPETLNSFDSKMKQELYSAEEYLSKVRNFIRIDNKYKSSFKYFFERLKEDGIKLNTREIEKIIGRT